MSNIPHKKISDRWRTLPPKKQALLQEPDTKVLLCGLTQCRNLGDVVIADCVNYLLKKTAKWAGLKNVKITPMDIRRQKDKKSLAKIKNSDLLIFPGGGFIKYKTEKFPVEMGRFTNLAEYYGIPVAYNAMGVEDYDEQNEGCAVLKAMLENRSSRYITCRDYADLLNSTYLKDSKLTAKRVADPALWCSEVYRVKRDLSSQTVGLGVARGKLFEDHGVPLSKEELLDIWANLMAELESRGIRYKLFTNGLGKDEDFLSELLTYTGKEELRNEITLPMAESSKQLVQYISGFSAVVACRMHANIIAFSLGIPSIGFVWNDKLRYFGESIGCSERFLDYKELKNASFIADCLQKAREEGCSPEVLKREKDSAYRSVRDFFAPFAQSLLLNRRRSMSRRKLVCYGLPDLKSLKLNEDFYICCVDFFVSDDESLCSTSCMGKPVYPLKKLKRLIKPFVLVSDTVNYTKAAENMEKYKYKENKDFTNIHSYTRYVFKKGEAFLSKPKAVDV